MPNDSNKIFQSKKFRLAIWIIGGLIVLLLVFRAGMWFGFRKAYFSFRWGENYYRNFGGPKGLFLGGFDDRNFFGGHGTFGTIINISSSTLTIKDNTNIERLISVNQNTIIKSQHQDIKFSDLKTGENIVVIGAPDNNGQITANFIRTFPSPPSFQR